MLKKNDKLPVVSFLAVISFLASLIFLVAGMFWISGCWAAYGVLSLPVVFHGTKGKILQWAQDRHEQYLFEKYKHVLDDVKTSKNHD